MITDEATKLPAISRKQGAARHACSRASEEALFKSQEYALAQIGQLVEDANNRLTFDRLNLAERYIKSQVNIAIKCEIARNGHHYRAFIERAPVAPCVELKRSTYQGPHVVRRLEPLARYGGANPSVSGAYRDDFPVLVNDIEFVESPKKIIPSFVWLELLDHIPGIGTELLYFSLALARLEFLRVTCKGETYAGQIASSVSFGESAGKPVKADAQVVNRVSGDQPDIGMKRAPLSDLDIFCGAVGITLLAHDIRLALNEGEDRAVKITDVAFGPFNL